MRIFTISRALALFTAMLAACAAAQNLTYEDVAGPPLATGPGVHPRSSLNRRWVIANDSSCPLRLATTTGIDLANDGSLSSTGTAQTVAPTKAFTVAFLLFDIWGDYVRTLRFDRIEDIEDSVQIHLNDGKWKVPGNPDYFISVAFVDRVMRADGTVWSSDRAALRSKLNAMRVSIPDLVLLDRVAGR